MTTITFPPVSHNNKTICSLSFREPTLGDLEDVERIVGDIAKLNFLACRLSGVSIAHIRQIPASHLAAMVAHIDALNGDLHGNA